MSGETGCWSAGSVWRGAVLTTARTKLRALTPEDAPRLVELLSDPAVSQYTALIPYPYSRADADEFIARQEQRRLRGKGIALAVERSVDRQVIGVVGFGLESGPDPELGYWLGRECWGQGFQTEILRRLVRHLFQDLNHARVWAAVHPENTASMRVLDKVGFVGDGRHACVMTARGCGAVDSPRFALTAESWKAAHAARPMLLVAAAALVDVDGRVLMATRPPGKSMSGLWEFPGGKVHDGETPETALIRELQEELGIDAGESCLAPLAFASHDYDAFHLLMPLYVLRQWRGDPVAKEGQSLRWVRAAGLNDLPMPPADIPLVALLREWV